MNVSILQLKSFPFGEDASTLRGENPNRERRSPDNVSIVIDLV